MILLKDAEKLIDIIESNLYLQKIITVLYELEIEDFILVQELSLKLYGTY